MKFREYTIYTSIKNPNMPSRVFSYYDIILVSETEQFWVDRWGNFHQDDQLFSKIPNRLMLVDEKLLWKLFEFDHHQAFKHMYLSWSLYENLDL